MKINVDVIRPFLPIIEQEKLFGREQILDKLTQKICFHKKTILFGKSGVGKSSLLHAGLAPKLQITSLFPVFVSLDDVEYIENDIRKAICDACLEFDIEYNALDFKNLTELLLFAHFKDWRTHTPITPLIIFDQFERYSHHSPAFFKSLWEIVGGIDAHAQFLFCVNTCQMYLLGDLINNTIGIELFYLPPFSYNEIREVTKNLFPYISSTEREKILREYELEDEILPAQYVINMHYYNENQEVGNNHNNIRRYYEECTSIISSKAIHKMEECLIGYGRTVHFLLFEEILSQTGLHKEDIQYLINSESTIKSGS